MAIEIERKFLVKNDSFKAEARSASTLIQGFLSTHKKRVVRIRVIDQKGYITIKGKSSRDGLSRFEWEKEIPKKEAHLLLAIAEHPLIIKTRYRIPYGEHCFEVDVFDGENKGLTVAEIELQHEEDDFLIPAWLGEEVTGQAKYYNAKLSKEPYRSWGKK